MRTKTCTHAQAHKFSDSYIATQFIQFHDKRIVLIITFTSNIIHIGDCQLYKLNLMSRLFLMSILLHVLWTHLGYLAEFGYFSHPNKKYNFKLTQNSLKFPNPFNQYKI